MPAQESFFGYTTGLVSLAVSASEVPVTVPIENTMDFVWTDGIYSCDSAVVMAGSDTVFGGALVNVSDQGKQNRLFKFPVPMSHVFGTPGLGRGWFRLPYMMRFSGNSNIGLFLTNLLGSVLVVRITFLGFQIAPGKPLPV